MPTLLTGQTAVERDISTTPPSAKSTSINTKEFLFYSNNPEDVMSKDCADSGRFLYKDTVSGVGQVYIWHGNHTGSSITASLLIYNPNAFAIKVNATNYGLTNAVWNDSLAWKKYFDGQNTSITIAAGGYGNLFTRTIVNAVPYGVVARLSITNNSTGAAASATLFDLAYINSANAGNATSFATAVGGTMRGKGAGFYSSVSFTIPLTAATGDGKRVNLGSELGSNFSGDECATLVDASGQVSSGKTGYGHQMNVTVTISNQTGSPRKFRVYLGSGSGKSAPVFVFNGKNISYAEVGSRFFYDIVESDSIAINGTASINFFTALPGGLNTPISVGVRPV